MHSRLPITLAQLKAENNSEKLKKLNQTIIVFFVQIKKKLQIQFIKLWLTLFNLETIFMNTENSKRSDLD